MDPPNLSCPICSMLKIARICVSLTERTYISSRLCAQWCTWYFFILCKWVTLTGRARTFMGMWTRYTSLTTGQWERKLPFTYNNSFFWKLFSFFVSQKVRILASVSLCVLWINVFREPQLERRTKRDQEKYRHSKNIRRSKYNMKMKVLTASFTGCEWSKRGLSSYHAKLLSSFVSN